MTIKITFSDGATKQFKGKLIDCWKWANQFTYRIAEVYNSKGRKTGKWVNGIEVMGFGITFP